MKPHSWITGTAGSAGTLLSLTALALFVLTQGPATAAPKPAYLITDLGASPPAYPLSYGQAVNNAGQVAGTVTDAAGGSTNAFLYDGSDLDTLGALIAGGNSAGFGLNDGGSVVGQSDTNTAGVAHAFVANPAGTLTDLTPGGGPSAAYGINDQNQIAGTFTASGVLHAFVYDPSFGLRDIGTAGVAGSGLGLASDAKVVGQANGHAFVTGSDGVGLTDLGTLGGTSSTATGINVSDEVAGYSQTTGNAAIHAFRTTSNGLIVAKDDLGVLTGGVNSEALGINDVGQVVGYSEIAIKGVVSRHAFLYDPNTSTKIQDLNSLANASGWVLTQASAISDSGAITGWGTYKGETTAFLLLPNGIQALAFGPATTLGAETTTGTLILSKPAPAGGLVVGLKSSNAALAQVPTSVTVPAGATTAQFTATVTPGKASGGITITATAPGGLASGVISFSANAAALAFGPASLAGGQTTTGTVTLLGPASAAATTVTLTSSNLALVSVPASAPLAAGAILAQFTATAQAAVAVSTPVTITATVAGLTTTAIVTVTPTTLTPLVLSPSIVDGGNGSTGVVTLNVPAPPSGATVALTSSDPSVTVPANVVIPSGSLTGTFAIGTSVGTTEKMVTLTATYHGAVSQTLDVKPTVPTTSGPNTMTISPDNLVGGFSAVGTVYFGKPVPSNNDPIYVSSSNTNVATVPQYFYAQTGDTHDTFPINTVQVSVPTQVTITATDTNTGTNASKTFTVLPLLPTLALPNVNGGASATGTVLLNGPVAGNNTPIYFTSSNTNVVTVPSYVYAQAGDTHDTFAITTYVVSVPTVVTITASTGSGATTSQTLTVLPQTPTLRLPTFISGGASATGLVTLSLPTPYNNDPIYFTSSNTAVLTVPSYVYSQAGDTADAFTINTNVVKAATKVTITAHTSGGTYTTATITVSPQTPTLVTPNVVGGASATGLVTLSLPTPYNNDPIYFTSSNTAVATVPSYVYSQAGDVVDAFTVNTAEVDTPTPVTITAHTNGGTTTSVTFTVLPNVPTFLTLNPASVTGGMSSTGTVTFSAPIPYNNDPIYFTSSNSSVASVPSYLYAQTGDTSDTFTVNTAAVATPTVVTISAHTATGVVIVSKQITVHP